MDIVIGLVFLLIALMAIALVVALFVKKQYTIDRQITINMPSQEIFTYLRHLKNQRHYSKWAMADPEMRTDFKGNDGSVGFVFRWDGNREAGKGEQEITGLKEGEQIDVQLRFIRPFESVARASFVTERITASQTKVVWQIEGYSNYPMNLMSLLMKGALERDLDMSLHRLKNILENNNAPAEQP